MIFIEGKCFINDCSKSFVLIIVTVVFTQNGTLFGRESFIEWF